MDQEQKAWAVGAGYADAVDLLEEAMSAPIHLDTDNKDKLHPYCGIYLGAGGVSTVNITDATCYQCVEMALDECARRLYRIGVNDGRRKGAGE